MNYFYFVVRFLLVYVSFNVALGFSCNICGWGVRFWFVDVKDKVCKSSWVGVVANFWVVVVVKGKSGKNVEWFRVVFFFKVVWLYIFWFNVVCFRVVWLNVLCLRVFWFKVVCFNVVCFNVVCFRVVCFSVVCFRVCFIVVCVISVGLIFVWFIGFWLMRFVWFKVVWFRVVWFIIVVWFNVVWFSFVCFKVVWFFWGCIFCGNRIVIMYGWGIIIGINLVGYWFIFNFSYKINIYMFYFK